MNPIATLRSYFRQSAHSTQYLAEIRAELAEMRTLASSDAARQRNTVPADIEVAPLVSLDYFRIPPNTANPIAGLTSSPQFEAATEFFGNSPARSRALVSPNSQALLYNIIRNLNPACVVEIGSYKASTTEAMARALHANGEGIVHTVDPYGAAVIPPLISAWPPELRRYVQFFPKNSMDYFDIAAKTGIRPALIFIDGNHDYEYAMFDILSSARLLKPGGVIVVDNISQPGPYLATLAFMKQNPNWSYWGEDLPEPGASEPFDRHRVSIVNTDFAVLKSPEFISIGSLPVGFGQVRFAEDALHGIGLSLGRPAQGTFKAQLIVREFRQALTETIVGLREEITFDGGEVVLRLAEPFTITGDAHETVEIWLDWDGSMPLELVRPPRPLASPDREAQRPGLAERQQAP